MLLEQPIQDLYFVVQNLFEQVVQRLPGGREGRPPRALQRLSLCHKTYLATSTSPKGLDTDVDVRNSRLGNDFSSRGSAPTKLSVR
jgi:hypothetical protein